MSIDLHDLLENLAEGLFFLDFQHQITFWGKSAEQLSGYPAEDLVGQPCSEVLIFIDPEGNELGGPASPLQICLSEDRPCEAEAFLQHKDGHRVPGWAKTAPLRSVQGEIIGIAIHFADGSHQAATQLRIKELERLSLIDPLTLLANRKYLDVELKARFEEMSRYSLFFGLLYIDIDHFKRFNQSFGRNAGDLALQNLARTLSAVARPFDLFGRWEEDAFVGLIRNVDKEGLDVVARRCLTLLAKTYVPLGHRLENLTISLGATLARLDEGADSLLKRSEQLMLQSKAAGRNRITRD